MRLRGRLASVVLIGWLVAGCGDDGSSGRTVPSSLEGAPPEEIFQAYLDALVEMDAETACALLTESSAAFEAEEALTPTCQEGLEKGFASEKAAEQLKAMESLEVGEATIDGETAIVSTTSGGYEFGFTVIVEGGSWKVETDRPVIPVKIAGDDAGGTP